MLKPFTFRTLNSIRSKSQSLKYERFTPSGCKLKESEDKRMW